MNTPPEVDPVWIVPQLLLRSGIERLDGAAADTFHSFQLCIENHRLIPSLVLAYSWIDTMGAVYSASGRAGRAQFIAWLERFGSGWLTRVGFSAADFYGARCGVLHTLSPYSDMSRSGAAKPIAYAWGERSADDFNIRSAQLQNPSRCIHVVDLGCVVFGATTNFFMELQADLVMRAAVAQNVTKGFFVHIRAIDPRA